MAIVEVFLGAFLTVLLEMLASGELLKFLRSAGIDAQLREWRATLLMIKAVLTDAEHKQTENEAVKEWLNDLENLAYDLDDFVDQLNTEALHRRLTASMAGGGASTVRKLLPTCCTRFSFVGFIFDSGIASQLQDINGQLEVLFKKISMLSLVENAIGRTDHRTVKRLQMTSLVDESDVHGRDEDREKILEMLLGAESSTGSPISVIPVLGMGGVGKTTLVQLVYNDDRLAGKFDLMAWVCVSDEFNAFRVTKIILEAVSGCPFDCEDFNMLQVKLKVKLLNKKFLLVLDDVWNENYGDWDILRRPFLAGRHGSKIIVTSRHQKVAKIMSAGTAYHVSVLSDADALSLLANHALGTKNFGEQDELKVIGKHLVKRCKNLPLAVKAVGGILRTKVNPKEWEDVLNSDVWINGENSEVLPSLKLSYQYLPPQLKQCFAYCALFPKGYEFDKSELVPLWMAEGFLHCPGQERSMEELGSDYFDELSARSFFQQSSVNSSCYVMHDLLTDLAVSVAGDKCLMLDDYKLNENLQCKISENSRHLSFVRHSHASYQNFDFVNRVRRLRTFLPLPIYKYSGQNFMSQRVLLDLLPNLCYLRALSLSGYDSIHELPSSIGDLRHLRYLNLTRTSLKSLPESVSNLVNLQVLILKNCDKLIGLPAAMENLINLRHLDIVDTNLLQEVPKGIAQLKKLQTLTKVIVSKDGGLKLKDLGNLSLLQGEISIMELQNVMNIQDAIDARLMYKQNLNKIRLAWNSNFDGSRNEKLEAEVLNALRPHKNLTSLEIEFYGGTNLPRWIEDLSFSKLAKIRFSGCKNCTNFPTIGHLPSLRELSIQGMNCVKEVGVAFYGGVCNGSVAFQSLRTLTLEDMPECEEWHGITLEAGAIEFPKLSEFFIRRCPKLIKLPILSLPSARGLKVEECDKVVLSQMHNLTSLTHLRLEKIYGLASVWKAFPEFPMKLHSFEVHDCENLVSLWPDDNISERLDKLWKVVVRRCPQLLSIQEIGALPVVTSLSIDSCAALQFLPNGISHLTTLAIQNCPLLKTLKLHDCTTSLESLIIDLGNLDMQKLLGTNNSYSSLTFFGIHSCDLESFPHGGLPTPTLRHLHLTDCLRLKTLPDDMELLSCLKSLWIENCPSLVEPFPQRNIPPNLISLAISNCGKLKPLAEWNLHRLSSLYEFVVGGGYPELVSFSRDDDEYNFLPPSLSQLWLSDMPKLETLSNGFQNLTSLRRLSIYRCPNLVALPMEDQLENLWSLWIDECPLITKRCLKSRGDYWSKIAYIPEVLIDGVSIH